MKQSEFRDVEKHVTVLGWLHIGLNLFMLFIGLVVFFILIGAGLLSADGEAMSILAVVGTVVLGIMVVISIPGIIAGWGLLKRKSWARILALVIGVLSLMNIPFGTILGVYTLWALLLHEDASEYFWYQQFSLQLIFNTKKPVAHQRQAFFVDRFREDF